jgi:hypothetical protein
LSTFYHKFSHVPITAWDFICVNTEYKKNIYIAGFIISYYSIEKKYKKNIEIWSCLITAEILDEL